MDKSSKAVDAALKALHEVETAFAATQPFTNERFQLLLAVRDAKHAYGAALRAEKTPRVSCARCQRRFKPGEPMVWRWRHRRSAQLCLRCDRREYGPDQLADLDPQPCATCARPMYFAGFRLRRSLTCSYQCGYRRKLKRQLERKRVAPATVACAVCGEMFTQRRRDAQTCSNKCRQKLFRRMTSARITELAAGDASQRKSTKTKARR